MDTLYKVTPKEKKSISLNYEVFQKTSENKYKFFNISETYSNGRAYKPTSEGPLYLDDLELYFDPNCGFGNDLEELHFTAFEFDESFSESERNFIQFNWLEHRESWLYDGKHDYSVSGRFIVITSPFIVDIVNAETGATITEYVTLQYKPRFNNTKHWPYGDS